MSEKFNNISIEMYENYNECHGYDYGDEWIDREGLGISISTDNVVEVGHYTEPIDDESSFCFGEDEYIEIGKTQYDNLDIALTEALKEIIPTVIFIYNYCIMATINIRYCGYTRNYISNWTIHISERDNNGSNNGNLICVNRKEPTEIIEIMETSIELIKKFKTVIDEFKYDM